jgi:hypothetical protein
MLNKLSITLAGATFILMASTVSAHSPEMHKKANAEKPNCEGMQNMDHGKMDMNDPVMQAMMAQCMSNDSHGKGNQGADNDNHSKGNQGMGQKGIEKQGGMKKEGEHKDNGHHG